MKVFCKGALAAVAFTVVNAETENPLGKTIQLLSDLQAKIIKEGETEAQSFGEYTNWCEDNARNGQNSIKTLTSEKQELEAKIGKDSGHIGESNAKIEELSSQLATVQHDIEQAAIIREAENKEFKKVEADLTETIAMLERAISVLSREMAKTSFSQLDTSSATSQVQALTQLVESAGLSTADSSLLQSVLEEQNRDSELDLGAPAPDVYKSKSGSIVETLEDLRDKASAEVDDLRKQETTSKHNYELLHQSLSDEQKVGNKDMDSTKSNKASAEESKATAAGELDRTEADLKSTSATLEDTRQSCMKVAQDHEASVHARAEELNALAAAKKILKETSSGAVGQTYSFAQLSMHMKTRGDLTKSEVLTMLFNMAKKDHSASLSQLATRVSMVSDDDQFSKIKGLIRDMISKLEDDADSDATEKAYCDKELAYTKEKLDNLNEDAAKASARLDQATARSAQLKSEVATLQADLAELAKSSAEMGKIRHETHDEYVAAKKDLELGLNGVRKALQVLREYYTSSGASMLQQPAISSHSSATGAGTSIISMLEVVESDFAKALAREQAGEEDAQTAFEKSSNDDEITKTSKEQDIKYKSQEAKTLDKEISELQFDLEGTNSELKSVNAQNDNLRARCIAKPETYADRKARREAEIAGLKTALQTLEDETAFVQRRKQGNIRGALQF